MQPAKPPVLKSEQFDDEIDQFPLLASSGALLAVSAVPAAGPGRDIERALILAQAATPSAGSDRPARDDARDKDNKNKPSSPAAQKTEQDKSAPQKTDQIKPAQQGIDLTSAKTRAKRSAISKVRPRRTAELPPRRHSPRRPRSAASNPTRPPLSSNRERRFRRPSSSLPGSRPLPACNRSNSNRPRRARSRNRFRTPPPLSSRRQRAGSRMPIQPPCRRRRVTPRIH